MKKTLFTLFKIISIIYITICVLFYFFQESIIFSPDKLPKKHKFYFNQSFSELSFIANDNKKLNGILFKADSSKGLIFYLHGNAGSLKSWGDVAKTYTDLDYDVFMLDYRGYGKSEGKIESENQFYNDIELVYNKIKTQYNENKIIILGYSIGTFAATKLASKGNSKLLILQSPYYSLTDLMKNKFSFLPTFILKYKFETCKYIPKCKMPILIFHGKNDGLIYHESSFKLRKHFKRNDKLIILENFGHNGMSENQKYLTEIEKVLD